jgi:hypothetical protein
MTHINSNQNKRVFFKCFYSNCLDLFWGGIVAYDAWRITKSKWVISERVDTKRDDGGCGFVIKREITSYSYYPCILLYRYRKWHRSNALRLRFQIDDSPVTSATRSIVRKISSSSYNSTQSQIKLQMVGVPYFHINQNVFFDQFYDTIREIRNAEF